MPDKRIAVVGGAFDPFHRGHAQKPLSVYGAFGWDSIVYVPTQRDDRETATASPYHRYAMAVLATEDDDRFRVSDASLHHGSRSPHELFKDLIAEGRGAITELVLGADHVARLARTPFLDEILAAANIILMTRDGVIQLPERIKRYVRPAAERGARGAITLASNATDDLASTEVRQRIREGRPITGLVDPRVESHIRKYDLYR